MIEDTIMIGYVIKGTRPSDGQTFKDTLGFSIETIEGVQDFDYFINKEFNKSIYGDRIVGVEETYDTEIIDKIIIDSNEYYE